MRTRANLLLNSLNRSTHIVTDIVEVDEDFIEEDIIEEENQQDDDHITLLEYLENQEFKQLSNNVFINDDIYTLVIINDNVCIRSTKDDNSVKCSISESIINIKQFAIRQIIDESSSEVSKENKEKEDISESYSPKNNKPLWVSEAFRSSLVQPKGWGHVNKTEKDYLRRL